MPRCIPLPPPLPPRCRGEHVLVRPLLDEKYVAVPNEVSWARMGIETRARSVRSRGSGRGAVEAGEGKEGFSKKLASARTYCPVVLDEKYVAVPNESSRTRMDIETREKRAVEREWAGCVYCTAGGEKVNRGGGLCNRLTSHTYADG